ncbi:MAG: chemotaxis protein CheW [Myxococcales bacterium]|nr:chemotaxis protein CheW [Myxococcales bacterium]
MALLAPRKAPEPDERKLVLFGIGSVVYGVAIENVREVVNPQPIIALPHAPPSVVGVTHHRGEVVPVVDLRHRFGLVGPAADDRRIKWIMLDAQSTTGILAGAGPRPLAAIVDEVLTVFPTREPLRPPPALGGGDDIRGILGVVTASSLTVSRSGSPSPSPGRREQLVFVLDLDRLRLLVEPIPASGLGAA